MWRRAAVPPTAEPDPDPKQIAISVHIHVLDRGKGSSFPIAKQVIATLNADFSKSALQSPFRFELASYDVSTDHRWVHLVPDSEQERDAKTGLHQGGASDLNLYFADIGEGLLGWATFPWDYSVDPVMDGVVLPMDAFPSVSAVGGRSNVAATHEVGHWLGLYHVFQGGCDGLGDAVPDTAPQAEPSSSCGGAANTCPGYVDEVTEYDPWQNFMDYTDDRCMWQFSRGQSARMNWAWQIRTSAATCGNGTIDVDETCDVAIPDGSVGACPTSCGDGDPCTVDTLSAAGTCSAACSYAPVTVLQSGDGCCPAGGDPKNDSDCVPNPN